MSETVSRRDSPSEAAAASTGRRVLVVDDHPDVRAMFSLALSQAGMRVLTASDGHDALELIERDLQQAQEAGRRPTVALIVLDLMMPGLSGFDVLRTLRARFTELPPVLIISALDSRAHVQEGIALGAVEFVSKPIEIELLRHKVRTLIDAPPPPSFHSAPLRGHDVAVAEKTEGAQPLRTDKPAAPRKALWIG
ncbi:MAG TPA: response regulator transcription factor [Verrucomicrobiae bacterium]|nr:response regulator transcription factor [Verrucomicrobiae bacterium]